MNTIVIGIINHTYGGCVHKLSYCLGAPHCGFLKFCMGIVHWIFWCFLFLWLLTDKPVDKPDDKDDKPDDKPTVH